MSYLFDTNVLLRLANTTDPAHAAARNALRVLRRRREIPCFTPKVLAEFWSVCTRPASAHGGFGLSPVEAERWGRVIERYLRLFSASLATYREWRQLLIRHAVSGVKVYDARLLTSMHAGAYPRGGGGGHDAQAVMPAQAGIQKSYVPLQTALVPPRAGQGPPPLTPVDGLRLIKIEQLAKKRLAPPFSVAVALIIVIIPAPLQGDTALVRAPVEGIGGGAVSGRALDQLVEFPAIQPDAAASGAIIDLDALALGHVSAVPG